MDSLWRIVPSQLGFAHTPVRCIFALEQCAWCLPDQLRVMEGLTQARRKGLAWK